MSRTANRHHNPRRRKLVPGIPRCWLVCYLPPEYAADPSGSAHNRCRRTPHSEPWSRIQRRPPGPPLAHSLGGRHSHGPCNSTLLATTLRNDSSRALLGRKRTRITTFIKRINGRPKPQSLGRHAHEWPLLVLHLLKDQVPQRAVVRLGGALQLGAVEDQRAANVFLVGAAKYVLAQLDGGRRCVERLRTKKRQDRAWAGRGEGRERGSARWCAARRSPGRHGAQHQEAALRS